MSSSEPSQSLSNRDAAKEHYNLRAEGYDQGHGGWHIQLGKDFAEWLSPTPGSAALDLACGTGLVAIPLAQALGRNGLVVGIDVTSAMLAGARAKTLPEGCAPIKWLEEDVMTDLMQYNEINEVVDERGGFDIISCCSAFILLSDPDEALENWMKVLKPGGKLIIDVPTNDPTLQYLLTEPLRRELHMPMIFDRSWIKDVHSLEEKYIKAGLEIERSWHTRNYLSGKVWEEDQMIEAFDAQTTSHKGFADVRDVSGVKEAWKKLWHEFSQHGKVPEGHSLFVTIGRKP